MNFHDDVNKMFQPLVDHCKEDQDILSAYMYMYHDDQGTHFYKHIATRDYIQVAQNGKLLGGNVRGWNGF